MASVIPHSPVCLRALSFVSVRSVKVELSDKPKRGHGLRQRYRRGENGKTPTELKFYNESKGENTKLIEWLLDQVKRRPVFSVTSESCVSLTLCGFEQGYVPSSA